MANRRFRRILIANRGEIAARIIRTVHALGFESVAVYSEADKAAPYLDLADCAVPIGPPEPSASYLNSDALLAAALRVGADAVHPGYGFLSENADFAAACTDRGLVFIGPSASAIRAMGDKREAKERMQRAGVPCIPGYTGDDQSDDALVAAAGALGYPLMVKAAAGGGGKGMRLVASEDRLRSSIAGARSEAVSAFNDGILYLERALVDARHIEIQIVADEHGNTFHLGERDCSVQRRHQKIIEEAPSPFVDDILRDALGRAAINAARAVEYKGVGTVEFLVDAEQNYYFLEMNTRLQVEHAVTEAVYGADLVAMQLRIAAGEILQSKTNHATSGHAIEARLYAEDPSDRFLPQTGEVSLWRPCCLEGVRFDAGIEEGSVVSTHYDPMLAKVIAHGSTREEARRKLLTALARSPLLGVKNNRSFLLQVLASEPFAAGDVNTSFINSFESTQPSAEEMQFPTAVAALLRGWPTNVGVKDWCGFGHTTWLAEVDGARLRCSRDRNGTGTVWIGADIVIIDPVSYDKGVFCGILNGLRASFYVAVGRDHIEVERFGWTARVNIKSPYKTTSVARDNPGPVIVSPMVGRVVAVDAAIGQQVEEGQRVMILEAMKMEFEVRARRAGRICGINVKVGEQVILRQVLAVMADQE